MKPKNLHWILFGAAVIALGMFYDRILNLPSEGFQDLARAMYVILLLYPALFFLIGLITNYRDPIDWVQLVILTLIVVLVAYLKTGKIELDRSWLIPATYPLFNLLGMLIGRRMHYRKKQKS